MSPYDFKYLKSVVSIHQVLSAYGMLDKLVLRNHQLSGPCPLHKGDNRTAFRVNPAKNVWNCFTACGGGDTVDLIRKIENCSHADAARIMKNLAAEAPPVSDPRPYHSGQTAFSPFIRRIALNPKTPFLQKKKRISAATAVRFESGVTERSAFLRNAVAVRLHDFSGEPLGYCARRLDANEIKVWGKWRFPKGFPKNQTLYNAHRAIAFRKHGVIVTECPWSVMRISQAGFPNAVSLLGTALSVVQKNWLVKAPLVFLMLDGDSSGRKAASEIAAKLDDNTKIFAHHLPDGYDPDDLSDDELRSLLLPYFPFSL